MILRTILLVGKDPYQLHRALCDAGFVATAGFQIIEAGGVEAAKIELEKDDSIVAVATADPTLHDLVRALVAGRKGTHYALVNTNGIQRVPHIFALDLGLVAG